MRVVVVGGDCAHFLGSSDGVVVVLVLVLPQKVAHFHVLEEVFGLGVLVSQVYLVVSLGTAFLSTARLLLLLRPLITQRIEEVLVDLLERIGCEEQVVILLLKHINHYLTLLWIILTDALEFLSQLPTHFRHVHIPGQIVRNVVRCGWWVFRPALSPEEVVVFSGKEPGRRVVPHISAVVEDKMVLSARGKDASKGLGIKVAVLITADDVGGEGFLILQEVQLLRLPSQIRVCA